MNKDLILKGIKYYSDNGVNFILEPNDGKILTDYINELNDRINKAVEYINSQSPDAGVSGKHIKDLLKGDKE